MLWIHQLPYPCNLQRYSLYQHTICKLNIGNVIHILQNPRLVQSKGQRQQIDGDYKFLTCCSIVIFSFSNHFYRVAATTGGLLVSFCVYFEIGTLAFASWSIPVAHSDLKCSHDLLC